MYIDEPNIRPASGLTVTYHDWYENSFGLRKPKKVIISSANGVDPNKDFHLWTDKSSIVDATSNNGDVLRRFCPTVRQSGVIKLLHRDFMNLHFKPLKTGLKVLDKIDISICDQLDRPLKFIGGKSIATLCIRRK